MIELSRLNSILRLWKSPETFTFECPFDTRALQTPGKSNRTELSQAQLEKMQKTRNNPYGPRLGAGGAGQIRGYSPRGLRLPRTQSMTHAKKEGKEAVGSLL